MKKTSPKILNVLLVLSSVLVLLLFCVYMLSSGNKTEFRIVTQGDNSARIFGGDVVKFMLGFETSEQGSTRFKGPYLVKFSQLTPPLGQLVMKTGVGGTGKLVSPYNEYIPGGAASAFPEGRPIRATVQVLDIIPAKMVLATDTNHAPERFLIVDVGGVGGPDRLNPDSVKESKFPYLDGRQCRKFSMDGTPPKFWEWVGPKSGLLVFGESGVFPKKITGEHLFGFHTGLQKWSTPLEALALLDGDKDSLLKGSEVENLFLWVDSNKNAVPDDGEIGKISDRFPSMSLKKAPSLKDSEEVNVGEASSTNGVKVGVWEFSSRGEIP